MGAYRPPHLNPNSTLYQNGVSNDTRYDSQQLLDVYKHMVSTGQLNDPRPYFAGPWDPSTEIDSTADGKELGPEVCWLSQPRQEPLALRDMDDREKDVSWPTIRPSPETDSHLVVRHFSECTFQVKQYKG